MPNTGNQVVKYLVWILGLVFVVGNALSALAVQTAEIDGADEWRIASGSDLHHLSLTSNSLGIASTYTGKQASFTSSIIETKFPFTALGAHWQVKTSHESHFELSISTSADGYNFGPFRPIAADVHLEPAERMPDGRANPKFGATLGQLYLHPRSDGQFFRYRITLSRDPATGASPMVERVGFTVIDTRLTNALTSENEPIRLTANTYPKPAVVSRAAWGARPGTCNYAYCSTTHVAVHHTASVSDYSCSGFDQCSAVIRAIQTFHMDGNGWCDLGYNYLATPDGTLWEGRGGGDDVRGAHDGHNCGSMGVSNVGYFHPTFNQLWTNAQQDAVAELTSWKSSAQGIDPFGMDFYVGLGATNDNFYGHRDVSATACPGDNVYGFLPDLRSLVDAKLNSDTGQIVLDTSAVNELSGTWSTGTFSSDKFGPDYLWTSTGGNDVCAWKVNFDGPGLYDVSLWWPAGSNRSSEAQVFVKRSRDDDVTTVNQQINGGQWNSIGAMVFERGDATIGVSNAAPSGDVVMCDALRLVPLH